MGDMLKTVLEILTPEHIAAAFWGLDDSQMCDFFAELDRIAGTKLCFQMVGVVHRISERGEQGDYAPMNGFRTMLAHSQNYAEGAASWRAGKAIAALRYGVATQEGTRP